MISHPTGYIVAFDFGLRHIGVAIGQTVTVSAQGVSTIRARTGKPEWRAIEKIMQEYAPQLAVVGLPLNMDGTSSPMAKKAETFAKQLAKRCKLEVVLHDERLSTRDAQSTFAEAKAMGKAHTDHELAACLILESWLHENVSAH